MALGPRQLPNIHTIAVQMPGGLDPHYDAFPHGGYLARHQYSKTLAFHAVVKVVLFQIVSEYLFNDLRDVVEYNCITVVYHGYVVLEPQLPSHERLNSL